MTSPVGLDDRRAKGISTRHSIEVKTQPTMQARNTWIPTDASGAGLSLTIHDAFWVQHGRIVFAFFNITYPATASGATAKMGGLPFTPRPTSGQTHPVPFAQTTAGLSRAYVHPTDTTIHFSDSTGLADANNAGLSTKTVGGVAIYEVAEEQEQP